jgi:hypothetical protein
MGHVTTILPLFLGSLSVFLHLGQRINIYSLRCFHFIERVLKPFFTLMKNGLILLISPVTNIDIFRITRLNTYSSRLRFSILRENDLNKTSAISSTLIIQKCGILKNNTANNAINIDSASMPFLPLNNLLNIFTTMIFITKRDENFLSF